ncbi:hypothetical protein Gpo141_00003054 [Globisporangium polare]
MALPHRDHVLHTGVLFKKGSGIDYPFGRRNWKTRYFVLTPSVLKYYNYEGGAWKGEVDLGAKNRKTKELLTTIEVMPGDSKKTGTSASTIWRIAINSNDRRLLLSASSEIEMNRWVEQLTLALEIARGNSVDEHLNQRQRRLHRMSLPDNLVTNASTFLADFPVVAVPRRRMSIGTLGERNSIGASQQQQQQFWDFPVLDSNGSISSPRRAGATYETAGDFDNDVCRLVDEEFKSNDTSSTENPIGYGDPTSNATADVLGTPPPRYQVYYYSERQSLPEFPDLSPAPPPKSIADFHNFSRSRRRMSLDNGMRLRRRLSVDAQLPSEVRHALSDYKQEQEEKEKGEKSEEKDCGEASARPMEKRNEERRRWRRFARFREWFSRH